MKNRMKQNEHFRNFLRNRLTGKKEAKNSGW